MAVSRDGGASFGPIAFDTTLIDPINAASIIRDYQTDFVYFSNAAHASQRVRMTVRRSADFAKSWEKELLVFEGRNGECFGHRSVGVLGYDRLGDDTFIGLLWETNSTDCEGPSCRTLFSFIPKYFSSVCWVTESLLGVERV